MLALVTGAGLYLSRPSGSDAPFVIEPGESVASIVARLKDEGHIRSALFFKLALRESGFATKLQPGTYDLSDAETYDGMIGELTSGQLAADEVSVRILEGWTLEDIAKELGSVGLPGEDDLYAVTGVPGKDFRTAAWASGTFDTDGYPVLADKPDNVSLEGYLFPDTYRFFRDATAEDIVAIMVGNFMERMSDGIVAAVDRSGRSWFDVVTMASIVEREVRRDEDRRKVADLFWRRLEIGMALQADSTVNYATGKSLPAVTYEDTKVDSRYNTYRYPGLPLGPIGNPGTSALRAAADPEPNEYWYFLTDTEGNVHYARTLDEHNANKATYLR